jgi:hypothetical protein
MCSRAGLEPDRFSTHGLIRPSHRGSHVVQLQEGAASQHQSFNQAASYDNTQDRKRGRD